MRMARLTTDPDARRSCSAGLRSARVGSRSTRISPCSAVFPSAPSATSRRRPELESRPWLLRYSKTKIPATHAGRTSRDHTSRSGSLRSGSIAWARICDVARSDLERRSLGMELGLAEIDNRIRAPGDDPHRHRLAACRRVEGIDSECGERRVHRARERRHQVRLPLISTRGRVQIGSGLDCTCSMTQRRTLLASLLG